MNTISKTTRISALLPVSLVDEVKKESQLQNIAQSHVIKKALELWLQQKLKRDAQELATLTFDDLPSEDDWLSVQSKTN
jgi:Arc/MetJ-type ribon-helix-helix transcriptional regulator